MNFRNWLERAIMMDPWEAMEVLGLQDKANQTLSEDELGGVYKPIALANHPDKNPDPEAVKTFKRATEAFEVLQGYIGQVLPAGPGIPGRGPQRAETPRDDWYGGINSRYAPLGRYSMADFEEWVTKVADLGYFQAVVRQEVGHISWGMNLASDSTSPLGSKERTFRVSGYARSGGMQEAPRDKIRKFVTETMSGEGADLPGNIVDLKINERWGSAWVTYAFPRQRAFGWSAEFRSLCFDAVKKKEPKKPGTGMKVEEIEAYLREQGLTIVAGGRVNAYYGLPGDREVVGIFIQIAGKTIKVVKRERMNRGIEDIRLTKKSFYFGEMTKGILDKWIEFLKRKRAEGG